MKKIPSLIFSACLLVVATGCTLSLLGKPTSQPTSLIIPSPTVSSPLPTIPTLQVFTPTVSLPTVTPPSMLPTLQATGTVALPSPTTNPNSVGQPSGPYAVINVVENDVLNIRSGAGAGFPVSGSFAFNASGIMQTGLSAESDGDLWVQVQNPTGGTGWVNSAFLVEAQSGTAFCADSRVNTLLTSLGNALLTSNGQNLASLVSPNHGVTVYLWRYGIPHTFKQGDARWVFSSTYEHNWGDAPGSGLATLGSFHQKVLPFLQDVFGSPYTLTCNSLGTAAQYGYHPWPVEYANVNYYTVFKPGSPGVDLDWRYWLVGVEYVKGQPTLFALIHFAWEP